MTTRATIRRWPRLRFARTDEPFRCSLCNSPVKTGAEVKATTSPCRWMICDYCAEAIGEMAFDREVKPIVLELAEPRVIVGVSP